MQAKGVKTTTEFMGKNCREAMQAKGVKTTTEFMGKTAERPPCKQKG